jgi:hypothetical protein
MLGTWLARQLALPPVLVFTVGDAGLPIMWSIVGSTLFVAVLGVIAPRRPKRRGV